MVESLKRWSLLAGLGALVLSVVVRAQTIHLNVKLGLWEATTTTAMTGMPPVDIGKMNLTPEQRAKMEAAMKAMSAPQPPRVSRTCITEEKLNRPLFHDEDANCKNTVVTSSATVWELKVQCSGTRQGSGDLRIEASSPETVDATMKMTVGQEGKTMNVDSHVTGRWISSSCGNVK